MCAEASSMNVVSRKAHQLLSDWHTNDTILDLFKSQYDQQHVHMAGAAVFVEGKRDDAAEEILQTWGETFGVFLIIPTSHQDFTIIPSVKIITNLIFFATSWVQLLLTWRWTVCKRGPKLPAHGPLHLHFSFDCLDCEWTWTVCWSFLRSFFFFTFSFFYDPNWWFRIAAVILCTDCKVQI